MNKKPLGLFVNGIETEYGLPILKGIDKYCSQNNVDYYVYLIQSQELPERRSDNFTKTQIGLASIFNKKTVSAVLTTATSCNVFATKELYNQFLKKLTVPVVSIGVKIDGISSVFIDNFSLAKEITEHFIKCHNVRKFLLIKVNVVIPDMEERISGFYAALKEAGIPKENVTVVESDFNYGSLSELLKEYKTKEDCCFDSVICVDDVLAIESMEYFEKAGIRIPEDLKFAGFDDCAASLQTRPPLTTVNQQLGEQGIEACRTAFECFEQSERTGSYVPKHSIVQGHIKYRQSCGCTKNARLTQKEKDSQSILATNYYLLRQKIHLLQKCLQNSRTTTRLDDLKQMLYNELIELRVPSCTIVTFNKPIENNSDADYKLPDEACVFLHVDSRQKEYVPQPEIEFNPNEMMLPEKFCGTNHLHVFTSLSNERYQFGYVVYNPNSFDFILYATFTNIITNAIASTYELSALSSKKDALESESYTDELTGIFNRRGLAVYGQNSINQSLVMHDGGLVIFADMDDLKVINDTFGHESGDEAIKAEVKILRDAFRTSDIIARFGGDEFVIVAPKMTMDYFKQRCARIDEISRRWNEKSGKKFTLSISLGAVEFSSGKSDLTELIAEADKAQYEVKKEHHKRKRAAN